MESEKKWCWGGGGQVWEKKPVGKKEPLFASRCAGKDWWWELHEQSGLTFPFLPAARKKKVTQRLLGVAVLDYTSL